MENRKKAVKLYNVLFPFWMLMLVPSLWLIVLPGNFIIDSLVLVVSMAALKLADRKTLYKRSILKIFGFGLLADFIGTGYMLLMLVLEWTDSGDSLSLTLPALILSAAMIFVFHYFIIFKKTVKSLRLKLALIFSLVTAPYTFLVPTSWLY